MDLNDIKQELVKYYLQGNKVSKTDLRIENIDIIDMTFDIHIGSCWTTITLPQHIQRDIKLEQLGI